MRNENRIDYVPVIMISSDTSNKSVKRAYEYGASDFMHRPFDEAIVRQRVANIIALYTKQRCLSSVVAEIEYYRSHLTPDATAVITGGSAHQISERLSFDHTVVDGLVSQGLNNIILYNESIAGPRTERQGRAHSKA